MPDKRPNLHTAMALPPHEAYRLIERRSVAVVLPSFVAREAASGQQYVRRHGRLTTQDCHGNRPDANHPSTRPAPMNVGE
jgi:hypothetical protein